MNAKRTDIKRQLGLLVNVAAALLASLDQN